MHPGVNALRTPVYPEMINIVNGQQVAFKDYKFDRNNVRSVMQNYYFGGTLEPSLYGLTYTIENISPVHKGVSKDWFTFEQDGYNFKATLSKKFKQSNDCYVVDVEQI